MDCHPLVGYTILLDRWIYLNVVYQFGYHALGDFSGVRIAAYRFQKVLHIHTLFVQLFHFQPQGLNTPGVFTLLLFITLCHFRKPGIVNLAGNIVLIQPFKERIQFPVTGQ